MAELIQIRKSKSAADFLDEVAAELRERGDRQPMALVVLALTRDGDADSIEFFNGPQPVSPMQFLGMCEMGKDAYLNGGVE